VVGLLMSLSPNSLAVRDALGGKSG
jgi:hypothetical protein